MQNIEKSIWFLAKATLLGTLKAPVWFPDARQYPGLRALSSPQSTHLLRRINLAESHTLVQERAVNLVSHHSLPDYFHCFALILRETGFHCRKLRK